MGSLVEHETVCPMQGRAYNAPVIPRPCQFAARRREPLPHLMRMVELHLHPSHFFGSVREQDINTRVHCQTFGTDRRGYHRHSSRHRFQDF